jgi:AraC-like DNA-binding protein
MDPLSDVLSLLKPRSYSCGGTDVAGDFSVQYPRHEGIKCYAIVSGQRWLSVEGVRDPVHLTAGDCFLLPRGRPFRLASDLTLPSVDALTIHSAQQKNGGMLTINGGGDCVTVGAHFILSHHHAGILLGVLPPIVHIRTESDKAAMRWSLERLGQELREPQPGGFLVAEHLAYLMLVQALRLHLAEGLKGGVGWLFALGDRQMSAAITAMHDDPAHRWTLQQLAQIAGMSRSIFAQKFKDTVGEPPMEYLLRWRMTLAGDKLVDSSDPISVIALSLGYESESAFGKAFKRVMGCSPRQYSRGRSPTQSRTNNARSTAVALVEC